MVVNSLFAQTTPPAQSNLPLQLGVGVAMTAASLLEGYRQITAEPRARARLIAAVKAMPNARDEVPALYALVQSGKAFTADEAVKALYTQHEFGYKLMQHVLGYDQVPNLLLFTDTKRLVKLDKALTLAKNHVKAPFVLTDQRTENLRVLRELQQSHASSPLAVQQEIRQTEQLLERALKQRELPEGSKYEFYFANHVKLQLLKKLQDQEPKTITRLIDEAIDVQETTLNNIRRAQNFNDLPGSTSLEGATAVAFMGKPNKLKLFGKVFFSTKPFGRGKITVEKLVMDSMHELGKFAEETGGATVELGRVGGHFARTNLSVIPNVLSDLGRGIKGSPTSVIVGIGVAGLAGISAWVIQNKLTRNTQK